MRRLTESRIDEQQIKPIKINKKKSIKNLNRSKLATQNLKKCGSNQLKMNFNQMFSHLCDSLP
jgi:hypothetical protein